MEKFDLVSFSNMKNDEPVHWTAKACAGCKEFMHDMDLMFLR